MIDALRAAQPWFRFIGCVLVIAVTHAVLCGPAVERLDGAPIDKILITDSIPLRDGGPRRVEVVSVAPPLGRAIMNIHRNESVSPLFEECPT